MQPIMEIAPEEDKPASPDPERRRRPVLSSNFYPLTVFLWVLGVATVGVTVGLVCTTYFHAYTALLWKLIGGGG